jgi:tRNA 2-thiouridine synthesizing protein E
LPNVTYEGKTYTLDDSGHLDPPDQWDEVFARGAAREMGAGGGLTDRHWLVIDYLRRKAAEAGAVPVFVVACMDTGLRIREFRDLFPTGYHRGACRIAGISFAATVAGDPARSLEVVPQASALYPLDALGYLRRFEAWDEAFALRVAREWGVTELTDRHRDVIRVLREHFVEHGSVPVVYEACRAASMTLEELRALFPGGYHRGACRMAGLPPG